MSLPECAGVRDPSVAWWTRETEVLRQRLGDDRYKAKGEGTPEHEVGNGRSQEGMVLGVTWAGVSGRIWPMLAATE